MVSISDIQKYYLSFFGCIEYPEFINTDEIVKEVSEDINANE